MTPDTRDFLLTEYTQLRGEVLTTLADVAANEKLALLASVALWAWLGTHAPGGPASAWLPWLPLYLTALMFFRWRALENKFTTFGAYLGEVERSFALDGLGWEQHIQARARRGFRFHGWLYWLFLALGNLAALLGWLRHAA